MKIFSVFGTRPEAIKMAPVVLGLQKEPGIISKVCVTAQHRQMLDQVLDLFEIKPDYDLDIMSDGQDLFDVTSKILLGLRDILRKEKPDIVLVQGDTTSCLVGALSAFYEGIKIGHIEAGLRTGNLKAPFPEEGNRALVSRIADYHFAPTETSCNNLLKENISEDMIWVTGNTVIDALLWVRDKVERYPISIWKKIYGNVLYSCIDDEDRKLILVTGHRRESFGQGFSDLCSAIYYLAEKNPEWDFIYPVHLNPNVQRPVKKILSRLKNVYLIAPLEYAPFVWLMSQSDLILSDSGGVQEEAPSLGKPVLLLREVTERPEGVKAGTVKLVGTNTQRIVEGVEEVLLDEVVYKSMSTAINPYGDGKAAQCIIDILL